MKSIPRNEYPRPNLVRSEWLCLNVEWDFKIDNEMAGRDYGYYAADSDVYNSKITVPFCPESELSGIGVTDFINCVWYRKEIEIPATWQGKEIILHIGACDYETKVYAAGRNVCTHKGGYTPIRVNITDAVNDGKVLVVIEARDNVRAGTQISGKQSVSLRSRGCFYTRTTGIWQTVWLEALDRAHIVNYSVACNIDEPSVSFDVSVSEAAFGKTLTATVTYEGREVGRSFSAINSSFVHLDTLLTEKHLWEVGAGRLYDVKFEIISTEEINDTVSAYFGLRSVVMNKDGMFINGKYVFGRFVLDQGFYPDGIYTAPSDEALEKDILDSMSIGFNGARLHQKVFEPRFLYYADKHGYMLWDEAGNWGLDHSKPENIYNFIPEWLEEMERDKAHPSVIGWCPLNETWDRPNGARLYPEFAEMIYNVTLAKDSTRPCIINSGFVPCYDVSGNQMGAAFDVHDYTQEPEKFAEVFAELKDGVIKDQLFRWDNYRKRQKLDTKKTVFVSEYGGIGWVEKGEGWGYGNSVKSKEEFLERLEGLTAVLRENPLICGFCYTQLYDVEQEKNGILTYERQFKFNPEDIKKIFAAPSVKERV